MVVQMGKRSADEGSESEGDGLPPNKRFRRTSSSLSSLSSGPFSTPPGGVSSPITESDTDSEREHKGMSPPAFDTHEDPADISKGGSHLSTLANARTDRTAIDSTPDAVGPETIARGFLEDLKSWMNDRQTRLRETLDQEEHNLRISDKFSIPQRGQERWQKREDFAEHRDRIEQQERTQRNSIAAARTKAFVATIKTHAEPSRGNQPSASRPYDLSVEAGQPRPSVAEAHLIVSLIEEWETRWNNAQKDLDHLTRTSNRYTPSKYHTKKTVDRLRKDLEKDVWDTMSHKIDTYGYLNVRKLEKSGVDISNHNEISSLQDGKTSPNTNLYLPSVKAEIFAEHNDWLKEHPLKDFAEKNTDEHYEYTDLREGKILCEDKVVSNSNPDITVTSPRSGNAAKERAEVGNTVRERGRSSR